MALGADDTVETSLGVPLDTADSTRARELLEEARRAANIGPGASIGRFVVLDTLGEGAMGLVLGAFDPLLDRKVALKLLRNDKASDPSTRAPERLMREARAMARLSHPNVIVVHEVGTFGARVFVAMGLAAGGTLRGWCAVEKRSWREVLGKFVQAGRGLDAAHRAGLVHRDFKPDNVLLTADGVVRVADFGLVAARAESGGTAETATSDVTLTATATVLGTPAYMAPEAHRGQAAGPAADQFAFCVSLWEALFGERPFPGATLAELERSMCAGNPSPPPQDREVPAWLRAVVERGLRTRAEDRWPSLAALVAALENDPEAAARQRRRRVALFGAVAVLLFGASQLGRLRENRCRGARDRLAAVWNPARAGAVRAALAATGRPYAGETFTRVAARLDGYGRDWAAARTETCEATHVRGEQSEALLDLRMACLDRRLAEVQALVGVLANAPGPSVVDGAVVAATRLSPLAACADAEALRAIVPPPADPAARAQVAELGRELASVKALDDAGQYPAALQAARPAATRAEALGYAPVLATALFRRGVLEEKNGDPKAAEATLERALTAAADARDDALAARIWTQLIYVIGYRQQRHQEALRLRSAAEVAMRRAGADPELQARSWNNLGNLLSAMGEHAAARDHFARALALREKVLGPDHYDVAASLNNLGNELGFLGDYDEGIARHDRALATFERLLGPDHPMVAVSLYSRSSLLSEQGRLAEAQRDAERGLAIRERIFGPDHPLVAQLLDTLSIIESERGDDAQVVPQVERALATLERVYGPTHPDVADALTTLGEHLAARGKLEEARPHLERALAIAEAAPEPEDSRFARTHRAVGELLAAEGHLAQALPRLERARAIYEKSVKPDAPSLAYYDVSVAETLLALGRPADALPAAERSVRLWERTGWCGHLARARFVLARVLARLGRDRPRALALAVQACAGFGEAGAVARRRLDDCQHWITAQR